MREHLYWRSLAVGLVMLCCLPSAAEAFFNLRGWAEQQTESGATPVTDFSLLQVDRGAVTVADARTEMLVKQYEEKEQFSECWRGVVGGLKQSCQAVVADQHERSRLALGFTNCQLTTDGKTEFSVNCPPSYDVSKCVARLDASIYPVYLQFSLHVDTLCFHVQQEMARRKADATVARLQRATNDLKVQVGDLGAKAEDAIHVIDGLRTDARRAADDVNSGLTTLLHAQERLGHDIEAKQASMANLATAIESAHEKQTQVAAALQKGMGEVEAVARRQSESINRIGLAAQTIKQGIEEAKSSAARLMADQAALGAHVQDVGQSVKALQSAQDISTEKAERLTEQLSTVMATLDTALKNQLDAMDLIHQRTLLIATEADAQQRYLVQMHESLNYVQSVAVSVESTLFYLALSIGIVLLTTARPLAESRFAALMWGPVACAVVEKWFRHEGTLFLTIVKLGAAKPSMVFDWGLFMEFVTPAAQSCPVRQLHWSFAAVVAVVLAKAWWSYESPETKQRRAVEAAVSRAFVDAFSEGGLAAKYLVRSYGLERVTTRAKTPPPPSRPTDVIESLS